MLKSRKHIHSEKGQSLVELAISLVIIIMLLIGVVDFGLAFFSWVAIRDASQEGAIYGAVCPANQTAVEDRVRSTSTTPVDMSDGTRVRVFVAPIIVDPDNPASAPLGVPGDPVTVLVEFDYQSITPVASSYIGQNGFLTLRASTTNTILTTTEPSCP
jgi:Flp pilus assembly protein TadG